MVKPGYKLTELGEIPEDWECVSLGQLCSIVTGKKDVNEGNPSGQYPFFTCSRNLSFSDGYSFDCEAILIAGNGEVGNLHYYNGKFEAYQRTYVIFHFQVNTKYVYNSLEYRLKDELGIGKIGSSIPYIKKENLEDFTFFLPHPEEQSAISSVLSDIDALLDSLDALIAKKRAVKQAAMQELLTGKVRLPGFRDEWVTKQAGVYVKFDVGFPFSSSLFNTIGNGMRLIKNRDLKSDDQIYYTTQQYDNKFIVNNGDILIGMDGDFIPCLWKKGLSLLNQRVGRVSNKQNLDRKFMYYILANPLSELQESTSATTVKHLSHSDVENLTLYLPSSVAEQTAIAAVLSDMDAEIEALEARRAKTAQIKQGMMQELLTGKTRLPPFGAMSLG